ncbi:MAG: hypothetical protein J6S63_10430 [Atopobiaceae bacterium]|nr:hypothetical protein [Atopobiaceae bacterium]
MIKPYLADKYYYYWVAPGGRAPIVEWEVVLSHDVDGPALRRALQTAMRVHTNFRSHAVIVGGRPHHELLGAGDVPLFADDGSTRRMGTADTLGYLFYVAWQGRRVALRYFHSVADGRGGLAFMGTLLRCYAIELGLCDGELPAPDSFGTQPTFERILERMEGVPPLGKFDPKQHEVFSMPVERYPRTGTVQRMLEIDVPLAPLLCLSKRSDSSVVPTLQALIGRALHRTFDVGNKTIVAYTSIDTRRVFGLESGGNAATHFSVPYVARLDRYELSKRAMVLRGALDLQTLPENIATEIAHNMADVADGEATPYSVEAITASIEESVIQNSNAIYTYAISYPGMVSLPAEVEPFVDEVRTSVSAYTLPFSIEACEYRGTIRMVFTQNFADDGPVRAIYEQILREVPGTAFVDKGVRNYDELRLEELCHQ